MDKIVMISKLNPTLEQKSLLCIVIELWKRSLNKLDYSLNQLASNGIIDRCKLEKCESILLDKCLKLKLPPLLIKRMSNFIKPIGIEIIKWIQDQKKISKEENFLKLSLESMCWTSYGTVDVERSAEALIKSGKLNGKSSLLYELACKYCLKNYLNTMWKNLPYLDRIYCCNAHCFEDSVYFLMNHYIRIEHPNIPTNKLKNACFNALKNGNKAQIRFILGKLPAHEKSITILRLLRELFNIFEKFSNRHNFWYTTGHFSEIALILLANSDMESLKQLSTSKRCIILQMLLGWPVQPLFVEVAQCLLPCMEEGPFNCKLQYLCDRQRSGFFNYTYLIYVKKLLKLKPNFLHLYSDKPLDLLNYLFEARDKEGISLILQGVDSQMLQAFLDINIKKCCPLCATPSDWDFYRFFVGEFLPEELVDDFLLQLGNKYACCGEFTSLKRRIF